MAADVPESERLTDAELIDRKHRVLGGVDLPLTPLQKSVQC